MYCDQRWWRSAVSDGEGEPIKQLFRNIDGCSSYKDILWISGENLLFDYAAISTTWFLVVNIVKLKHKPNDSRSLKIFLDWKMYEVWRACGGWGCVSIVLRTRVSPRCSRMCSVSSLALGVCCFDSDDRLFSSCSILKSDFNQLEIWYWRIFLK